MFQKLHIAVPYLTTPVRIHGDVWAPGQYAAGQSQVIQGTIERHELVVFRAPYIGMDQTMMIPYLVGMNINFPAICKYMPCDVFRGMMPEISA